MKPNADWVKSRQNPRARSSTCCISCRREISMEIEYSDSSCCRKAEAGDSCMCLVMLAPDGHRISSMVTEAVKALTADEISELCVRHTLYDWSAQAGLKPMAVASAKGVHFTTVDGRRFIDFNSQLMSVNAGHGDRRIIEAIKRQAEQLPYITPFMAHEPRARVVRPVRHPDDLRRGHDRLRPHRQVVWGRPLGSRAGPHHAGQRLDQQLCAAWRGRHEAEGRLLLRRPRLLWRADLQQPSARV